MTEQLITDTIYEFGLDNLKTWVSLSKSEPYFTKLCILINGLDENPCFRYEDNVEDHIYIYRIRKHCSRKYLNCILTLISMFDIRYDVVHNQLILYSQQ